MKAYRYLLSLLLIGCSQLSLAAPDWHTYANYQDLVSTHVDIQVAIDFDNKQIKGYIEHDLKHLKAGVNQLILDTRDLDIHKAEVLANGKWVKTQFDLAERDAVKGSKLTIAIKPDTQKVRVHYNSRPEASGLQWLTPEQTAGKKHPFMFSQSQAIHARSWLPIQDTPAMRATYSATVKTAKDLRPVMSADNNPEWSKDGVYQFTMPQAIPPYLIAIAAGNIHHKKMSHQTAIYAEPNYLDAAAKEFEDTQAMIDATEKLFGKYRWGQYDLLILPPSFPFGGMENPRLSFITPTVIAGDKSLVNLIAHELAHSWSGNLVTNATWRDLWLNEGFTTYVENRIMEEVFGRRRAVMEQALGAQDLKAELKDLPVGDTILHVEIEGRDPDDAFSGVPYNKGQLFLIYLEEQFGRKNFDSFLRKYFDDHAFQSLDTAGFMAYVEKNLVNQYKSKVSMDEIKTWVFEPGLAKFAPNPKSDAFKIVKEYMDDWFAGNKTLAQIPTKKWTVHEWLFFINNLPNTISLDQLKQLDKAFDLTNSTNNEIAHAWLLLAINKNYCAIEPRLHDYLVGIGRRKLIVPLYKALAEKDADSRDFAYKIYQKARPGYHPLAQGTIDAIFADK